MRTAHTIGGLAILLVGCRHHPGDYDDTGGYLPVSGLVFFSSYTLVNGAIAPNAEAWTEIWFVTPSWIGSGDFDNGCVFRHDLSLAAAWDGVALDDLWQAWALDEDALVSMEGACDSFDPDRFGDDINAWLYAAPWAVGPGSATAQVNEAVASRYSDDWVWLEGHIGTEFAYNDHYGETPQAMGFFTVNDLDDSGVAETDNYLAFDMTEIDGYYKSYPLYGLNVEGR